MVMIVNPRTARAYEVYDVAGRHLGRVVEAAEPPAVGRGAATVLLRRAPEVRAAVD